MTNTARIANTLARILGFDQVAVTATAFETETESYVITSGTGEGGDFAYLASDVEAFCEGRESAHYSEDFCAEVSPVEDAALAWAALAEGAVLCRAGDCRAILKGERCEGGDTAEDYDCGEIVHITRGGAEVRWDSNQTTRQSLSVLRPEGERPIIETEPAKVVQVRDGKQWVPAIRGTLNQTGLKDDRASTFDTLADAEAALAACEAEAPGEYRIADAR